MSVMVTLLVTLCGQEPMSNSVSNKAKNASHKAKPADETVLRKKDAN